MKIFKTVSIAIWMLPIPCLSQIPVTDGASNAQLIALNKNVITMNSQLSTLNSNMATLVKLMERNTVANSNSSQMLSQEISSKRVPASFVAGSPEMVELVALKDRILEAYRGSRASLGTLKHLRYGEKEQTREFLVKTIAQVSSLMAQGVKVSSTPEMMESADRLSLLASINKKMTKILDEIISINNSLVQKNEHRKAVHSMIKLD
ncbi:MAG: hypothetical protein AAF969_01520 [Bacteroidota bacterium]